MEVVEEATKSESDNVMEQQPEQSSNPDGARGTGGDEVLEARDPTTRPIYRLSVKLIDTYKYINKVYYEAKAKKLREQQSGTRGGVHNDGYDDQNYDYIIHGDEIFAERYILKHRIGKGSFGQVVCAYDRQTQSDVAIKIIKSKHAFMVQARTEIRLLESILEKDRMDDQNVVRLLDTFVYRKHQCLVFEMLSYNLYELLKNTRFKGVSLALVRKFAKQILRGLEFLSREDVDIIHCDLKPENILLRHPKRSAIKIIDFGSSCLSTKKTYTYIQSRFYRSPEVLLGLPYSQKIDMWSLGCVLVEMHTGEPLFGGVNQLDQLNRIVSVMGMAPTDMIERSPPETRKIFFEACADSADPSFPSADSESPAPAVASSAESTSPVCGATSQVDRNVTITDPTTSITMQLTLKTHNSDDNSSSGSSKRRGDYKVRSLEEIIGVDTSGPGGRRKNDPGHSQEMYTLFVDFIRMMLIYDPAKRVDPTEALKHPYLHVDLDAPSAQKDVEESGGRKGAPSSGGQKLTGSSRAPQWNDTAPGGAAASPDAPPLAKRRSSSAPRLTSYTSPSTSMSSKKGAPIPTGPTEIREAAEGEQSKVSGPANCSSSVDDTPPAETGALTAPASVKDTANYVMEVSSEAAETRN